MCGIVGALAFEGLEGDKELANRESMINLFTEILQVTHKRGEDATGVSSLFDNGDFMIQKHGIGSQEFISQYGGTTKDYDGFIKLCRTNKAALNIMIGHCRKSSVGNTTDNENNHPIKAGEIVGIHNGTLKNQDIIFEKSGFERDGEVDSEAIFRLLQAYTDNGKEPFTIGAIKETVSRLEGTFSVLAYNINNPYQVAAFRDGRPMEFALIRPLKILLIASERVFIEQAFYVYNKMAKLYDWDKKLIKKDDIDFDWLSHDHAAVIDLTRPVTSKTKLSDIMDTESIRQTKKLWQTPTSLYVAANQYAGNTHYGSESYDKKSWKNNRTSSIGKTESEKEEFDGKIYCQDLHRYTDKEEIEKASKTGAVILTENDEIIELSTEEVVETSEGEDVKISGKKSEASTTEVDLLIDPKVVEAANESRRNLSRYSNDKELADDIDINDKTFTMVPKYAIANKIRRAIFENAFIEGAKYYKKLFPIGRKSSNVAAEKAIRTSKHITHILSEVLLKIDKPSKKTVKALKEILSEKAPNELDNDLFRSVFMDGDLKKSSILSTLDAILGAENGKEDSTD